MKSVAASLWRTEMSWCLLKAVKDAFTAIISELGDTRRRVVIYEHDEWQLLGTRSNLPQDDLTILSNCKSLRRLCASLKWQQLQNMPGIRKRISTESHYPISQVQQHSCSGCNLAFTLRSNGKLLVSTRGALGLSFAWRPTTHFNLRCSWFYQ